MADDDPRLSLNTAPPATAAREWTADAAAPPPAAAQQHGKVSKNVWLLLLCCAGYGFADSVFTGTVIVAWVQLLAGGADAPDSNKEVGYVEATQGMAMLLTALPVGYIADKVSRQSVIRVGAVGFLVAVALTSYAVLDPEHYGHKVQYWLLLGSMALWGTGQGIFNGPAQALFADSVPKGERSKWYTRLMLCYMLPSLAGPLAAIVLLTVYGDHWTLDELRPVFLFGVFAEVPPTILSFFMRDANALENGGDGNKLAEGAAAAAAAAAAGGQGDEGKDGGADEESQQQRQPSPPKKQGGTSNKSGSCCITVGSVPYVLFCSSLVTAVGSGMTIKFFPLFFKSDIDPKLSPRDVQGIYVCAPLAIAAFTALNQQLAKRLGRVQVMVGAQLIGVSLLVTMSILVERGITAWYIIVPVYVVRTGIMNSTYPLNESILMDFVPKETRARWKSLESIASFGWCGSAVLGGVLADQSSYSRTFLYTAGLQFLGICLQSTLMWVVPRKESKAGGEEEERDATVGEQARPLEEPLLGE